MTAPTLDLRTRRAAIVEAHIDAENRHNVEDALATFHHARYEVIPFGGATDGEQAVRDLLGALMAAFPDFRAETLHVYHSDDAVICEIMMHGTQRGPWMGLPAKGRVMRIPAACIYVFEEDRLMCEKVYFDTAEMVRQLSAD